MKKNKKTILIYTIFISLISTSVFAKSCFVCGGTYFPSAVATLVRNLYNLVKLLVPVLIIIMGMVDLLRAVMASDEKKMAEATPKLIKKLIAGVTIFLIFTIVQFVFKNLLGRNDALSNSLFDCVTYFISEEPNDYECPTREDNISDWVNSHTSNSSSSTVSNKKHQECSQRSYSDCTDDCEWYEYSGASSGRCRPVNTNKKCTDLSASECENAKNLKCGWSQAGYKCLDKKFADTCNCQNNCSCGNSTASQNCAKYCAS